MDRTPPRTNSDEIELYIRTYYSLLRSSGPIRIRSLEETHMAMKSNLHFMADSPDLEMSALVYSALRLPESIVDASLMVMGQMEDVFEREGYNIEHWKPVRARARSSSTCPSKTRVTITAAASKYTATAPWASRNAAGNRAGNRTATML